MDQNLHMQTTTWLMSREVKATAGPWNTQLLIDDDDGEYFCRVLLRSEGVKFVPDIGRSSKKIEAQFSSIQLHVDYIRSLEDSPRVRAACVSYLQKWLLGFYPERPDIVTRAEELAVELGGRLRVPEFSWKYAWLERFGGPKLAKRALVCPVS